MLMRANASNLLEPTAGKKKKFKLEAKIPKFKKMKIPKFSVKSKAK